MVGATLPGITARTVTTPRITTRVLFSGDEHGEAIIYLHGNGSSGTCWEDVMVNLPKQFRAPDLRGFGDAEPTKIVEGVKSWEDDVIALADTLGIDRFHVVGNSANGVTCIHLVMDYPNRILSCSLVATVSPFGTGTCTADGKLNFPDGAGGGSVTVPKRFVDLVSNRSLFDQGRHVLNTMIMHPPFRSTREDQLVEDFFVMQIGEFGYPGDKVPSPNWPFFAPGKYGLSNATSGKNARDLAQLYRKDARKPRVLWIRGAHDPVVQDNAPLDFVNGVTNGFYPEYPNYPGKEIFPPQPAVSQIRYVLQKYRESGGEAQEVELDCGHFPMVERVTEFCEVFNKFITESK